MIRLNVFIRVEAAQRAAVVEAAKELVAHSLNDKGCVAYDLFESATRPEVLMICETAHEQAAHFTRLVPRIQGLAEMKSERFEF